MSDHERVACANCEAPNDPEDEKCARCGENIEEEEEEVPNRTPDRNKPTDTAKWEFEGKSLHTSRRRVPRKKNPKERRRRRAAQPRKVLKVAEWKVTIPIEKIDEEERLVFGWANVPHPVDKSEDPKIDLQDDQIWLVDLEKAAYEYVEFSREGDEMHTETVKAQLVESMVFTPEKMEKMGVEWEGAYGWWVGYRVEPDTFEKIKSGKYKMLSIGGEATPVEVA